MSPALRREIAAIVGDQTLDYARTAHRASASWRSASTPRACGSWRTIRARPIGTRRAESNFIGNRNYQLANLLRASTAAPTYFEPESIPILEKVQGLFIDGGVSPHNNPALALFMMARLKPYGLCWETGPDRLTIVSIGTGGYRQRLDRASLGRMQNITVALHALRTRDGRLAGPRLALMQWFGESPTPWLVNSEIGTAARCVPGGPLFRFLRYDVRLESGMARASTSISS